MFSTRDDSDDRPPLWPLTNRARDLLILVAGLVWLTLVGRTVFSSSQVRHDLTVASEVGLVVDPNTVDPAVFEALPGLGPTLADRLEVARREAPFEDLIDLQERVRGIGPVTRERLRPHFDFATVPSSEENE